MIDWRRLFPWNSLTNPLKKIVSIYKKLCLSTCKKSNYITHFFLEILQRYCILVILSTLDIVEPYPLDMINNINLQKILMLICTKNQFYPSLLSWDIAKIFQTSYFEHFRCDWSCSPKLMHHLAVKFDVYLHAKINFIPPYILEI